MAFTPEFGTGFEMGSIESIASGNRSAAYIETTTVKTGTYSARIRGAAGSTDGWIRFPKASSAYLDVGAWLYPHSGANGQRIEAVLADGNVVGVRWYSTTKTWDFYINDVLIESGTRATAVSTWQHVQLRVFVDGSGYIQTKVDGVDDIDYSGDTQPAASAVISYLRFLTTGSVNIAYDLYVDDIAFGEDDWPGDIRFDALMPNGDDSVEWTPSTGLDNYALVDERPPSTVDYVSTSSPGLTDKYALGDWSGTAKTPQFVMAWAYAKKDTAGDIQLQLLVDSNGDEDVSAALDLSTSDAYYSHLVAQDPDVLDVWTDSAIDALKIGIRSA